MQYGMYIGFRTLPSPRLEQHLIFIVFPMFGYLLLLQGSREIGFSLFSRYLAILLFAILGQWCIFIVSQHSSLQYSQRGVNKFFGDVFFIWWRHATTRTDSRGQSVFRAFPAAICDSLSALLFLAQCEGHWIVTAIRITTVSRLVCLLERYLCKETDKHC